MTKYNHPIGRQMYNFIHLLLTDEVNTFFEDVQAAFDSRHICVVLMRKHAAGGKGYVFSTGFSDSFEPRHVALVDCLRPGDVWQGTKADVSNFLGTSSAILGSPIDSIIGLPLRGSNSYATYLYLLPRQPLNRRSLAALKLLSQGAATVFEAALQQQFVLGGITSVDSFPRDPLVWYRGLFSNHPYAVFLLSVQGVLLEANARTWELLECSDDGVIGNDGTFFFPNTGVAVSKTEKFIIAASGGSVSFDIAIVTPKGNRKVVNITYLPVTEKSTTIGVYAIVRDITRRMLVQHSLREREYQLKLVLEGADVGWWDWDLRQQTYQCDPKWWAMLGYLMSEVPQFQNFEDLFEQLIHPDDVAVAAQAIKEAVANGTNNYAVAYQLKHKDGHYVPVMSRGFITFGPDMLPARISGINMDITQSKNAEQAVQRSENNLKTVFKNTEVGYILVDRNLQIVSFNQPARVFTLCDYNKELKEGESIYAYATPEAHAANQQLYSAVLGGLKQKLSKKIVSNDGDVRYYEITFSPVSECGVTQGFIISLEHVTERVKADLDRTRSFNLLAEQNKRLLNFSYIVSHNLRSHTGNIKSLLSFLREAENADEQNEMMGMLEAVSEQLNDTITNLNEVVSLHQNVNLLLEDLCLWQYIGRAEDVLRGQIIAKDVLVLNNVPRDIVLRYNAAYLESIILNFLSNAIKYAHPDRQPQVEFCTTYKNGAVVLHITDNGMGIDLDRHGDKLFGLYRTFHNNADAKGIGLFLTKSQVDYMGGRIEVESEPDKGTTFKIFF
jgi:PAS domain S-box-containing protein